MYKKFDKKAEEIIAKMTLKEKIGQLNQITGPLKLEQMDSIKEAIRNGNVGSIISIKECKIRYMNIHKKK